MAGAATLVCVAAPAEANWQWTQWGWSPDQVIAASNGTVHAGQRPDNLSGRYEAGGRSFDASFQFLDGHLAKVELKLRGEAACQSMATDTVNIYGTPNRKGVTSNGFGVAEWLDSTHGNDVVLTYLMQTCFIAYGPLATASSTGL